MNIIEEIDKNADKFGDLVAEIYRDSKITYKQIKNKSDALADYIIEKYGYNNNPIIVYGHKEHEMIISFLACSKSGHPYIPIDITFPLNRVNDIIESSNPVIFINIGNIKLDKYYGQVLGLNDLALIFEEHQDKIPDRKYEVKSNDVYYILYTSGSTGKPKGVQITHKNLSTFIEWFLPSCKTNQQQSIVMNQVSYSFDVSVISIYIGLILNKTLFVIDKDMVSDFEKLFDSMKISNIALWISTPAFAEMCILDENFNKGLLPKLEKMIFAGEVLSVKLVNDLFCRFDNIKIFNGYGPTESTVLSTAIELNKEDMCKWETIPIGYGIDKCRLIVVDENDNECLDEVKGELCVIGDNISIGYYKNVEMTNKNFKLIEIDGKNQRCYKTGDIVYKKDNLFFYCGRKDFQIKLNGFRIELEDIENNIRKISCINNVVVLPISKDGKVAFLQAFVTLNRKIENKELKIIMDIKENLKKYLPTYMIPRKIKILELFPINSNGKVDRKRLLEEIK